MKKKVCFVLIAVAALTGCRQHEQQEENATGFETMTVSKQDITLEQSYPAQIEGRQSIKIIPRVEGYLRQICMKEGQRVKKGQVLFVIDQATYQAEVRAAEANVAVAKAGVETAQLNYDSRQTLHEAESFATSPGMIDGYGRGGGMLISTLGLLFVVPALFVLFQTLQERFKPVEFVESDDPLIVEEMKKQREQS